MAAGAPGVTHTHTKSLSPFYIHAKLKYVLNALKKFSNFQNPQLSPRLLTHKEFGYSDNLLDSWNERTFAPFDLSRRAHNTQCPTLPSLRPFCWVFLSLIKKGRKWKCRKEVTPFIPSGQMLIIIGHRPKYIDSFKNTLKNEETCRTSTYLPVRPNHTAYNLKKTTINYQKSEQNTNKNL